MTSKKIVLPVLAILVLAMAGAAAYFFKEVSALKENPNAVVQQEATELAARVGKLIRLPDGEVPTIATVADPAQLADQPFFAKAKTGDKVLIYSQARRAYLYDPVANKVLEVAPVNIGDAATTLPAEDASDEEAPTDEEAAAE